MIKYAFIKNRFHFHIEGCINPTCFIAIKYGDKILSIELFLDSLNTVVQNNIGLYFLEPKHTEFFKSFLSDTVGIKRIALVSFAKEYDDYHLPPLLIQEDFYFIYLYLSIQKLHRNSIFSRNTPSSTRLYEKDAHSRLTDTAREISEQISNQKPMVYHLPSQFSEGIKRNGVPLGEMSKTLGFDTEAFTKPKTMQDVSNLLTEGIRVMEELNSLIDKENRWHSRKDFTVEDKRFSQYMDENDNSVFLYLDPEIKQQMLVENRIDLKPWVRIFTVDHSYLKFRNKNGVTIGRVELKDIGPVRWSFKIDDNINLKADIRIVGFNCISNTPYDCEREVIKWLIENNLFDEMVDKNV